MVPVSLKVRVESITQSLIHRRFDDEKPSPVWEVDLRFSFSPGDERSLRSSAITFLTFNPADVEGWEPGKEVEVSLQLAAPVPVLVFSEASECR